MTIEAAVVIPLAMMFFIFLLFFFRILQIQTSVQSSLLSTGRKTAVLGAVLDSDVALYGAAEGIFKTELLKSDVVNRYVKGGALGVTLLGSTFDKSSLKFQTTYQVKVPVPIFRIKTIWITQGSYHHKWVGDCYDKTEGSEYVYVTKTGKSYHATKNCAYLRLSIRPISYSQVNFVRNKSGGKYRACPRCVDKRVTLESVFITDYGDRYHATRSCSSLKRTVYSILKTEVGERDPCNKCVGEEK